MARQETKCAGDTTPKRSTDGHNAGTWAPTKAAFKQAHFVWLPNY